MDATRRLHHPGTRPAQQVEGIDDERLDADLAQVLAAGATHAGPGRVRQERGHGERSAPGLERVSHRASGRR